MLSSQTKDEVTDAAVSKLRTALGGTLSVQNMIDAHEGVIAEAIAKVGFWRRKTQFVAFLTLLFPFFSHPSLKPDRDLPTDISKKLPSSFVTNMTQMSQRPWTNFVPSLELAQKWLS